MAEGFGTAELLSSQWPRKQSRKNTTASGQGPDVVPKVTHPMTYSDTSRCVLY